MGSQEASMASVTRAELLDTASMKLAEVVLLLMEAGEKCLAHLLDDGQPAESESAQVKLLATEMAVRVTNQAMQLHGGNGYTTERRIERYWRDARLTTIFEGTSEIQRRIISDRMLPRA
jgi:alkylation response protein AidB-like acyl-CoA dehydrogenase